MDTVLFQNTDPVSRSNDYTHENVRFGAVKGVQYAADGSTVLFDFYTAAGVSKPADVNFDFGADRKTLMNGYADVTDYVRTGLQVDADIATGVVAVYGKTACPDVRACDRHRHHSPPRRRGGPPCTGRCRG